MIERHQEYMDSCGNQVHLIFKGFGVDTDVVVTTPEGRRGIGRAYGRARSSVEDAVAEARRSAEECDTSRVSA
jgi:hypothetical protein